MNFSQSPNINYLWASLIIEELIRSGVEYFCISPGSRSSPLAVSIGQHPKTKEFVHFDERGSAYHALGYVSAARRPCALISTSGTAAANFFPAIIEASKKKLPLLILTADRPPELRSTGADQTIDQVKIFGDYVRWHFDFPCPTLEIPPEFVLTTIDQAVSRASQNFPGPVHLNCMFREPLVPVKKQSHFKKYLHSIEKWQKSISVYTHYSKAESRLMDSAINEIISRIDRIRQGIIVTGKLAAAEDRRAVMDLAKKLKWPIFPDISSGLRLGSQDPHVIHHFDQILLKRKIRVDGILHFGGRLTSKRYSDWIDRLRPREYIMALNHPLRHDPWHAVTLRIQSSAAHFGQAVQEKVPDRRASAFLRELQKANHHIDRCLDQFLSRETQLNEPLSARLISEQIPGDHGLFIANSLPIREMDMFASFRGKPVEVSANRGASGIDGTIASAAGFSAGLNKSVTLFIGDLAFLHDLNSLAMTKNLKQPLVMIVLNNNGGGIFSFLPIGKPEGGVDRKIFEKFLGTPHGFKFDEAALLFGLQYEQPATKKEFLSAYRQACSRKTSTIIEIATDREKTPRIHEQLKKSY